MDVTAKTPIAEQAGPLPIGMSGGRTLTATAAALAHGWSSLRWFVTSMMGDTAYSTYVAHQRRVHPGEPVPDERTFWRERFAEQDRTPGSRCC